MNVDGHRSILEELQGLLEMQIQSARRSDFHKVEQIAQKTAPLIKDVAVASPAENSVFRAQRERIAKLHRQLVLMLAAEKDKVGRQLKRLGAGKKTVGAYRKSV